MQSVTLNRPRGTVQLRTNGKVALHWESKIICGIFNAALCYMPVKKESLENKATNEKKESVVGEAKKKEQNFGKVSSRIT